MPKQILSYTIKRFKELGHYGDRPGRGRKRTIYSLRNRNVVKKRIQKNPRISMKKFARDMKISRETARLMAVEELGLGPQKIKEVQKLILEKKRTRLQKCKELLKRVDGDQ